MEDFPKTDEVKPLSQQVSMIDRHMFGQLVRNDQLPLYQFGVTNFVRVIHNIQHKRYNKALEEYYRSSEDFKDKSIDEIVKIIAVNDKKRYVIGDIEIPVHILRYYTDMNVD